MSSCLDISGCPFSGANECGEKERERERGLDAHVHIHAPCLHPPMNGAGNLAPGSRGAVSPSGQVNSWRERSTERLLHSRQCELPFQISIFYAYTCRTCGQPDTNNRPRGSFRGLILYARIPLLHGHLRSFPPVSFSTASLLPSPFLFSAPFSILRVNGQVSRRPFIADHFKEEGVEFRAANFSFPFSG